ncbi:hypothetical protein [Pyruvatibacter mobilis]|uniref:hypothetical protein n=1 Tax=Pyruvatibacter mobilis TaxID=1712261 RepID=UPI003BAB40E4
MTGLTGMRFMQRMRCQAAAVCLALVMAAGALPPVPLHAQEEPESFSGRYVGFALSDGAVVSLIEREGRVVGQYTDAKGRVFTVNGQRMGNRAQGQLARDGAKAFFQLEPRPLGIQFLFIPPDEAGTPNLAAAVQSALAREDVDVETMLGTAPRDTEAGQVFLLEGAEGKQLADAYLGLPARERELIRLFDHVQAHITGRICTAVSASALAVTHKAVPLALERQQAGCSVIATLRDRAMGAENYAGFEARLAVQQELLVTTMSCNAGDQDAETCQTAGAMNAAMFEQWRRAAEIFADVAEEGGTGAGTAAAGTGTGTGAPLPLRRVDEGGGVSSTPVPSPRPR